MARERPTGALHKELVDAVFLDENLMLHVLSFVPSARALVSLRVTSSDLYIAVMCARPKLHEKLEENKDLVLCHRQRFVLIQKMLRCFESVRENCLGRFLETEKYDEKKDDHEQSEWHILTRKWWREEGGWRTERKIRAVEAELLHDIMQSVAALGPLAALV